MKSFFKIVLYSVCCLYFMVSCVDESVTSNPSSRLEFSIDTLQFDTLFALQPSRTLKFMIYNHNDKAIDISEIYLGDFSHSSYRYNVDGREPNADNRLYNVQIKGNDSLYVFVEITPKELDEVLPIELLDNLYINYNTRKDSIVFAAYSQKVTWLKNYNCSMGEHLTSKYPYLIEGILFVPNGVTLTVEAGAKLYMHGGSNIVVDGTIECKGTYNAPILISGDRLDRVNDASNTPYSRLTNQWGSLYLRNLDGYSKLTNVEMRGSSLGILLMGSPRSQPQLDIVNCKIHTSDGFGIFSQNGNLKIYNSLIYNCARSAVSILGGRLTMKQTTLANYLPFGSKGEAALSIMNYTVNLGHTISFPVNAAEIYNTIIMGKSESQINFKKLENQPVDFNVFFSNCVLQMKENPSSYFVNCFWTKAINQLGYDNEFVSTVYNEKNKKDYDFHITADSQSKNAGSLIIGQEIPIDVDNRNRMDDGKPDIGAYEYQSK